MKRHCLLLILFIFLPALHIQAEGTAGKWSERYNVTAITMDEGPDSYTHLRAHETELELV